MKKRTHPILLHDTERVIVPGDPNGNGVSSRHGSNLRTQLSRRREGGLVQTVPVVGRVAGTFPGMVVQAGTGTGGLGRLQPFPRFAVTRRNKFMMLSKRSTFRRLRTFNLRTFTYRQTQTHQNSDVSLPSAFTSPTVAGRGRRYSLLYWLAAPSSYHR